MIPWDELEDVEPLKPEPIRKPKPSMKLLARQVVTDEKRHQAYGSCGRKRRYPSLSAAQKVGNKQPLVHGRPVVPYPCEVCDGFHLTSKPRK